MDTIRAFAAEDREAAEHRSRVADQRRKSVRSWDYANLRIDTLVAPMSVLTNVLGLVLAVALGGGRHGIEAIMDPQLQGEPGSMIRRVSSQEYYIGDPLQETDPTVGNSIFLKAAHRTDKPVSSGHHEFDRLVSQLQRTL